MKEECKTCGGGGQIVVGEHFVTQDMAIDAGEPDMAGMHHIYAYELCEDCEGSDVVNVPV